MIRMPYRRISNRPRMKRVYTTGSATPSCLASRPRPTSSRCSSITASPRLPLAAGHGADYARGLYTIDLATEEVTWLDPPAGIATTGLDGLYLHRGRLVATQNRTQPRRVVELTLSPTGRSLVSQQVLLSGVPRARDLSLGVVGGDVLDLNAAAGWVHDDDNGVAKPGAAAPHVILQLALPR